VDVILFGGTGYFGSHAAEQLAAAGHNVTCLVREGADTDFLDSLKLSVRFVDFDDTGELLANMPEGAVVCNCIADTRKHVSRAERHKVEIALTTRLFRLAERRNAERFVQLSTVMVYGFDRPSIPIDESHQLKPKFLYNLVAAEREAALLEASRGSRTKLVILRPATTLGKRDTSCLPNFVKSNRQGVFPVVDGGQSRFSCIDARDAGRAIAHLLGVPVEQAEVYLVKGYDTDWLSLKACLDAALANPTKVLSIPKRVTLVVARLLEALYPYGKNPPMTRFDLEALSHDGLFDDAKIRLTGFVPRYSLGDGIEDYLGRQQ